MGYYDEKKQQEKEALHEAQERAALESDPHYADYVAAYEKNAEMVRNMTDYEYEVFLKNLKAARIPRMPWWKRAWHYVTHDVDAAMIAWLGVTAASAVAVGAAASKHAKRGAEQSVEAAKRKAINEWNSAKESECYSNLYDIIEMETRENDGVMPLYDDSSYVVVDKDKYNTMAADANLNINEIRKLTGNIDLPSEDIYPKI